MRWYQLLQGIKKLTIPVRYHQKLSAKFRVSHWIIALWEVVLVALEAPKGGGTSEMLKCKPSPHLRSALVQPDHKGFSTVPRRLLQISSASLGLLKMRCVSTSRLLERLPRAIGSRRLLPIRSPLRFAPAGQLWILVVIQRDDATRVVCCSIVPRA
jgi:hypothetical protein